MGGKSTSSQQQTSLTTPWAPAQGVLSDILGQIGGVNGNLTGNENSALSGLLGQSGFLNNNFGSAATGVANSLLSGGPDRTGMVNQAYQNYSSQMAPTISGQFLDPSSNPFYSQLTNNIGNDVQNRINAMYAGAGRDPASAGSYAQQLGRGLSEGIAPVAAGIYSQERGNQLNAMNSLFGGGLQAGGLLSNLDTQRFANQQAGLDAAQTASQFNASPYQNVLAVEAAKRGIPLETLAQQMGLVLPAAQAFGTKAATTTGEQNMSGAQQFATIAQGLGSLFGGNSQKQAPVTFF